ncbi:MAG: hypothetical protein KKB70_11855, partial [Proteobacteria bacterium]|nr:hypothetical protein [Pseudomonadota bacterium]MBU1612323.1 hypothetical protein [Pseudomonadota bacterium]
IVSTIANIGSSLMKRQQRQQTGANDLVTQRADQQRKEAEERRQRKIEQREDARELEQTQRNTAKRQSSTLATSGAGLFGSADVGHTGLKAKLGE